MKTITLWLTSLANEIPGTTGYKIHVIDPDPGIDNSRRTLASGFGVPFPVQVPDRATITESEYDEDFLWIDDTALTLKYHPRRGQVTGWAAMAKAPTYKDRWIFQSVMGFAIPRN